jgi:hypothetical protein
MAELDQRQWRNQALVNLGKEHSDADVVADAAGLRKH